MRIVGDPGHGGKDPGAVYAGYQEDDITLGVALRFKNVIRGLGHDVILTRDRDIAIPLQDRVRMIETFNAQAFISIHANASGSGSSANGIETYFRDSLDEPLARCVQQCLATWSGLHDNGIFYDVSRLHKRLAVLNNYRVPSVLVEIGYLSNPENRHYIVENMNTIGECIAHGVDLFACRQEGREKTIWPDGGTNV